MEADDGEMLDAGVSSAWDVATRYHEFKAKPSLKKVAHHLREISTEAILEKARSVLGSVVHPTKVDLSPWDSVPASAEGVELELDETTEGAPGILRGDVVSASQLIMEYRTRRVQPVIIAVDTSLSMTGEKLALTAVALAVVLLQFPEDPIGIVAFENRPQVLKLPSERISVRELMARFLDVPAQGYTHLESGIQEALRLVGETEARGGGRPPAVLLLTDGKYTAGRDPAYLAPRFRQLNVMKMGPEKSSLPLCRDLAHRGGGSLREVAELESLPAAMYGVVKDLLRGRR